MDALKGKQFFANDGSFLERFKQLQEAKAASSQSPVDASKPSGNSSMESSTMAVKKTTLVPSSSSSRIKSLAAQTPAPAIPSSSVTGKLAFSLKQKPRPSVNALKLSDDEDGDDEASGDSDRQTKKQKLDKDSDDLHEINETIPAPPTDPEVKKIADKLACFIAKNGRQFENITRQKNPGDTPFRFLFDVSCPEYKYYEYRIAEEEKLLAESRVNQSNQSAGHNNATFHSPKYHSAKTGMRQHTSYQTPASALYVGNEVDSSGGSALASDSLAMMEFYVKKAAQEDMRKPAKYAEDEMPPPQCLETEIIVSTTPVPTSKRGHHMGDYIPQEELEKFLAKCNDAAAQKAAKEAAERAKIQADNVGHKLLSKMGWKEGEGLGSGNSGRADPVQAGTVKLNNLGVGAEQPGEVTPEDDIYEQYKKRMMLGYRFRPNPLNNPRKAYY